MAKIRKLHSLNTKLQNENIEEKTEKEWRKSEIKNQNKNNKELKPFRGNISPWNTQDGIVLYEHE